MQSSVKNILGGRLKFGIVGIWWYLIKITADCKCLVLVLEFF